MSVILSIKDIKQFLKILVLFEYFFTIKCINSIFLQLDFKIDPHSLSSEASQHFFFKALKFANCIDTIQVVCTFIYKSLVNFLAKLVFCSCL